MCGIGGYLGKFGPSDLRRMKARLHHRGPDDHGFFHDAFPDPGAAIGLVHTRLSIIDLSGGRQPMTNEDGSIVVVFNGEIYNHAEIRKDLQAKGHTLASGSDGEVIAHLYEEMGIDLVTKLRGMFAIAIWDGNARRLYLIRDRFGIKPVYWRRTDRGFAFASEFKALLAIEGPGAIDPQALDWFLSFRYVPEDRTMLEGIRKLQPAHWMSVDGSGVQIRRYWDLRGVEQGHRASEKQWTDELRDRLREAIRLRLMSEVPLGAFLSGGLDSSFIVSLMAGLLERPVETFSFGVAGGWHNETHYAEMVAAACRTEHHALSGDCADIDILKKAIWHLDEPLADTAIIPTYMLSRLTRDFVTVAMTGEGADELLGGYDKYKILVYGDRIGRFLPKSLMTALAGPLAAWHKPHRAARFLGATSDRAVAYMELVSVFNDRERGALLSPAMRAATRDVEPAHQVVRRILDGCHGPSHLDDLMHIDLQTWLPDDVLLKADKMSMAHGLEARVPFLDHEFAEFCASMPGALKLKRWREKSALREAMRGHVPDAIVARRKHGFTVPLEPWLEGEGGGPINRILDDASLERRGWFDPGRVRHLLSGGVADAYSRRQAFAVLSLELWAQSFLDGEAPAPPIEDEATPRGAPVLMPA